MRAVIPVVDPLILSQRKRFGVDQYDEMWEGEMHMAPAPEEMHQGLEGALEVYLTLKWAWPNNALVFHQINLAPVGAGENWRDNYRIPDLLLLTRDRFHIRCGSHWEGAPNVVVEIHSPGDEAYEKLPFYRDLAVPEVWIIHRDSKQVEIYILHGGEYDSVDSDAENWLRSPATSIEMKPTPPTPPSQGGESVGKLAIRVAGNAATLAELPLY